MKLISKYKKITFFIAVFLFVPVLSIAYSSQCVITFDEDGGSVDVNGVMSCIEERYGYDSNTLRRSNRKTNAPAAEIYFDNTEPEEGEKVTATAVPKFFKNTNENLYYTWFILHEGFDENDDSLMEDAKREAMGIVARGNYDPVLFAADYSSSGGDPDDDGFEAPIGGADGYGAKDGGSIGSFETDIMTTKQTINPSQTTRCYRRLFGEKFDAGSDFSTGKDLIIECQHYFPDYGDYSAGKSCSQYDVGDGKFTTGEEACWGLDPENPDTDGDGVDDEADLVGLNQQQFTWNYKKGDRVGVIIEGTSMMPTGEDGNSGSDVFGPSAQLNSYYKLMWGSLGICSEEDVDFMEGDKCDNEGEDSDAENDLGFNYWATKAVEEEGPRNLETDLKKAPDNPQADMNDQDYSDMINVNAIIKNESADSNYAYFDWDIYQCKPNDLENCSSTGVNLTKECGEGEQLKECAGDYIYDSESYSEGMGINKINFKFKNEIIKNDKEYFKVFLRTRRYKNDSRFSLSSILVPVTKNNFRIEFFEVTQQPSGLFGFDENNDKVCTEGVYKEICPVFPFQVVGAKAVSSEPFGKDVTFNWKINNEMVQPLLACDMYEKGCELGEQIYFPVLGDNLFLGDISLLVKREGKDDLMAERMFSINNPLAVIKSDNLESAWPLIKEDESESVDILQTYPGNLVTLKADMVPDYLQINKDVYLTWYINGSEVTEKFIEKNPELEIDLADDKIQYRVLGSTGGITDVTAKVEKMFSFDEKYALNKNWNILNAENLINETSVMVKIIYPGDDALNQGEDIASLGMFLASTAKNAPAYLITIVRLAVLLVIIWSVLFGFSYIINPRKII